MKQFAAFRCKMRQIFAEQDEADRSVLQGFAGGLKRSGGNGGCFTMALTGVG
jgi:hypothetical protein